MVSIVTGNRFEFHRAKESVVASYGRKKERDDYCTEKEVFTGIPEGALMEGTLTEAARYASRGSTIEQVPNTWTRTETEDGTLDWLKENEQGR
mmetsp:Transcript_267/g.909  ORF Transcript_267/g.909 Transcript_267/m.909 type:complete len:93 (+) Transcript_267:343-621(+)